jgi:hypothetical protein
MWIKVGSACASLLLLAGCVWSSPDTPANAAIHVATALQFDDARELEKLMCGAIASEIDFSDPETLGPLTPLYEMEGRSAFGGASEYAPIDSLDIAADHAWTELDFVGADPLDREVYRLHFVREDGRWRVCGVEYRPDAPTPPADIGVVDRRALSMLQHLGAEAPEDLRRMLLKDHTWSEDDPWCDFEDEDVWSVVATGVWKVKQSNGAYSMVNVETTGDLSSWRVYRVSNCEILLEDG